MHHAPCSLVTRIVIWRRRVALALLLASFSADRCPSSFRWNYAELGDRGKTLGKLRTFLKAAGHAWAGCSLRDKTTILLLIAFETTDLANAVRRARLKRWISWMGRDGIVEVCHRGRNGRLIFLLRKDNTADYSVASEFLRGGY